MTTDGNKEATKPLAQQQRSEDVGDFMSTFRSALTSLDSAQGGGRIQDSNGAGSMDMMPFGQGTGGYQGFRPEGLLSLAIGMSGAPYMDESLDGMEYEDESHMETGPDYVRMGYSRTMRGRGIYGQRSNRFSVQMMYGQGGVGFRSSRSSSLGYGGGLGGMQGAFLLGILGSGMMGLPMSQEYHDKYCPIHGTHRHHHGHHLHESEDGYNGPEIVELSDDEHNSRNGQMLALPAPRSSNAEGNICEVKTKDRKNKNINFGLISKNKREHFEEKNKETEGLFNKEIQCSSKGSKTSLLLNQTSEKSQLRRKQNETHGSDNRVVFTSGSKDETDNKVEISMENSNVFKEGFTAKLDQAMSCSTKRHLVGRRSGPAVLLQEQSEDIDSDVSSNEILQLINKTSDYGTDCYKERKSSLANNVEPPQSGLSSDENTDVGIEPLYFEDNYFGKEDNRRNKTRQIIPDEKESDNERSSNMGDGLSQSNTIKRPQITVKNNDIPDTGLPNETGRKELNLVQEKGGVIDLTKKKFGIEKASKVNDCSTKFNTQSVNESKVCESLEPDNVVTNEDRDSTPKIKTSQTVCTGRDCLDLKQTNSPYGDTRQPQQTKELNDVSKGHVAPENDYTPGAGVSSSVLKNESQSNHSRIQGFKQSHHMSETTAKQPEKRTFYQMVKSQLPANISQRDLDHALGLKAINNIGTRKNKEEHSYSEQITPTNMNTQKDDQLQKTYDQFENLFNDLNGALKDSKPKQAKQKNALPRFFPSDRVAKEQEKNAERLNAHARETSTSFNYGKETHSVSNTMSSMADRNFKVVKNSAGIKKSSTHHTCSVACQSYASRCSSCKKVHVYCECCDTIIRTLCGSCENCRNVLSPTSNQFHSACGHRPVEGNKLEESVETIRSVPNKDTMQHATSGDHTSNSFDNTREGVYSGSFPKAGIQNGPRPPKKPNRNKNASKGSTSIPSPNFTARPTPKLSTDTKRDSTHHTGYYNDGYYQRQSSSTDRLSSLSDAMLNEGLVVKDVYPDGNCFFAAVVDQLRVRGEFFFTAKSLRTAAVNYLRANPNQDDGTPLLEFVSDHVSDHGGTWEGYLSRLRRDGEWADHIIISAISSVLKRRIVIHSIRRSDQTINKTIMEPDCMIKLRNREKDRNRNDDNDDDQSETTKPNGGVHITKDDTKADEDEDEIFEDILLGHIPEAHYVSLRYLDWEERLFRELRKRKDEPQRIITEYKHTSLEVGDSSIDSNEDPEGRSIFHTLSTNNVSQLPTTHNNFLLKYIHDGNFFSLGPFHTFSRPKQTLIAKELSCMWGVGDRNNDLESYLKLPDGYTRREKEEDYFVEWFIVTPHDSVVTEHVTDLDVKNLRPVISGCRQGYLKLKPVSQHVWSNKTILEDGEYFLKHIHIATDHDNAPAVPIYISFKSEWPKEALARRDRLIRYRDVINDDQFTFRSKLLEGVRVVPICSEGHLCHNEDCIEWKYTFSVIEYVICWHILTDDARFCFKIMHHFLNFLFADKNIITKEHIKAVFFHTCDKLDVGILEPDFFVIISCFLAEFEICLSNGNIPDFFVGSTNLIANMDPEEIRWHYERICTAKEYYLVYMFLFLDQKGLMERFSLSRCFDSLLFDAFWKKGHNRNNCFERLTILESREWVLEKDFRKALSIVSSFDCDEISYSSSSEESDSHDEYERDLHKQVLRGIPLQEQWLYALYLESKTGLPLLQHVNKGRDCAKLKVYFGETAVQFLVFDTCSKLTSTEIELPLDICRQEGIASFANEFFDCLTNEFRCKTSCFAADASLHYFLCYHTDVLLRDVVPQTDEHGTDGRHRRILDSLFQLFDKLLYSYRRQHVSAGLTELVDKLEKVTDIEPSVHRYEKLASIWTWLENTTKSQEALEKANIFRQNYSYQQKTTRV